MRLCDQIHKDNMEHKQGRMFQEKNWCCQAIRMGKKSVTVVYLLF